jgi:DNA-binding response OmpR family regulator
MASCGVDLAGDQLRVLVAEDDKLLASTVHDFLLDEGFDVCVAVDGAAALEAAADFKFDILLTDLRMPRLDGFELIRRLRADRPQLPVVVMSGNAPADLSESLRPHGSGPMVIIAKPMRLGQLLAALRQCGGGAPMNG